MQADGTCWQSQWGNVAVLLAHLRANKCDMLDLLMLAGKENWGKILPFPVLLDSLLFAKHDFCVCIIAEIMFPRKSQGISSSLMVRVVTQLG